MQLTIMLIAIVISLIWLINILLFNILLHQLEWKRNQEYKIINDDEKGEKYGKQNHKNG